MSEHLSTEAIVLKTRKVRGGAGVVHLFTKSGGPLEIYHRGLFQSSNRMKALLDLGHILQCELVHKGDMIYLNRCTLIKSLDCPDYESLNLVSLLLEILLLWPTGSTAGMEAGIYQRAVETLAAITQASGKYNALLAFQVELIHAMGIYGDPSACATCERPLKTVETVFLLPHRWSFACRSCTRQEGGTVGLTEKDQKILSHWLLNPYSSEKSPHFPPARLLVLQQHIGSVLEEYFPLKTLPEYLRILKGKL